MKNIIRFAILSTVAVLVLGACQKQEITDPLAGHKLVPVQVALGIEDVRQAGTKAAVALLPEVENWIFDYYYCQFNSAGISIATGHRRATVTSGDMEVSDQVWLYDLSDCTVTYVANIKPAGAAYGDDPGWEQGTILKIADNLETYKIMKFDMSARLAATEIDASLAGALKHMPMCGYWQGDITEAINTEADPFHMIVTLGRMVTKMFVNLTNKTGQTITQVTLQDAAQKAHIFPQVENPALADADYADVTNTVNIANNDTAMLVFYSAPNFCTGGGKHTKLAFTTAGGKTGSVELGSDVAKGDYNLYMNTIYTLSVTVK
ncbi:MAG: DUF4906 domain-containing protein [Bacteroidales bacterium]|nr:DUF4906 domain-containing protein [Bacteroidales bacterium]